MSAPTPAARQFGSERPMPTPMPMPTPARMPAMTRSAAAFGVLQAAAVLAWIAQLAMDAGAVNAVAATIILAASTITFQLLRVMRSFTNQPFSSLAVLGLCMTTQWGALVVQSGAWTPVADNLRSPLLTFGLLGCYQVTALGGLWLSAHLPQAAAFRAAFGRGVLGPIGIFEMPAPIRVWCLGFFGFFAIVAGGLLSGGGGIAGKLIDGFRFLAWAPFIIPVLARRDPGYCHLPRQMTSIVAYTLLVVGLGMAVNARTIMFVGVMTVGLLSLMLVLGSDERMRPAQLWKIAPAMLLASIGVGYASDLATATVIVRDQRNSAGPLEMIKLTVETLFDRSLIDTFNGGIDNYSKLSLYDEYYISNQVLTRLIETKFHDNMFFLSANMQPSELKALRHHTVQTVWASLPDPILKFWDIPIDKADLAFSVGDLFDFLHYGSDVGSFKIGSIFAHGQALFGYWFVGIYLAMCTLVFALWDSFAFRDPDGGIRYAPIAMLSVFGIFFNTISGDSIMVVVGFLLRGTAQGLFVYAVALAATRVLFPPTRSAAGRLPRVTPFH